MYHTFALVDFNPPDKQGRPIIPKGPALHIYSLFTFEDLFKALRTAKASPDLVAALNMRVSDGIRVPRDFDTLQKAVSFLEQFPDSDKDHYSISLPIIKNNDAGHTDGNAEHTVNDGDAEHKANDNPDIVTIPRKIVTIPRKIIVGEGEHKIDGDYLWIRTAVSIVGDPKGNRDNIVVVGGIAFNKGIQGNCLLQHMTLRQAKKTGVYGDSSFTMEDVLVEECGLNGVWAHNGGVHGFCTNVEVRQCGRSGVFASNGGSITLIGAKTTVHHNCTKGAVDEYGLKVFGPSSTIQLVSTLTKEQKEQKEQVSTLTKEQVSIDNGGGGNWGAEYGGYINQIKTMTEAEMLAVLAARSRGEVRVPEDCATLEEALQQVHGDDVLTTIVVGKGEHQIDDGYLEIFSAMTIVGDPGVPKSEIVVIGGIFFREGIQGNCHLQHMTLRQATESGVIGQSSFTMEDVLVEQCVNVGVVAYGNVGRDVVGRCTNVEVRQCGGSGVVAMNGGSITLIGANTTVHHNCTRGKSDDYGLQVWGFSGQQTIQLVFPLTKEQVSIDNSGGGNWGAGMFAAINQIKTITL
jgi:hypothetical protein